MKLIGPFSQIITLRYLPAKGALSDDALEIISSGGILVDGEKIAAVDSFEKLAKLYPNAAIDFITEDTVALPGIIDCHTHLLFGGSRAADFSYRNAGMTYLEMAERGGGIWQTVTQTRNSSDEELLENTRKRVSKLLANGVTTVEIKSGYGLSVAEEIKLLKLIQDLKNSVSIDVISTCLAAHVKPKDFSGTNEDYLQLLENELFPQIKSLTNRIDIFVEKSAFTPEEARNYLISAKNAGFNLTVHGDQFTTGGVEVAVETGAQSVDHLEVTDEKGIHLLANSNTVGVVLPGASIGLGEPFAPMRKLLDAGACIAIASDWNPGSAPMGDVVTQAAIIATFQKITNAEIWAGLTFRAALALGLTDRGRIQENYLADIQAYPTADYREILYQQGELKPVAVWKNGRQII